MHIITKSYTIYKKTLLVIAVALLFLTTPASAQNENFFDYQNGLSSSLIDKICIDSNGFVWAATEDGLNRFDGSRFVTFSDKKHGLDANMITIVKQISSGEILVGTNKGLYAYSYIDGMFRKLNILVNSTKIHPFVSDFVETDSTIWITTSGYGLLKCDKNLTKISDCNNINIEINSRYLHTVFADKQNRLWIGSYHSNVFVYDMLSGHAHKVDCDGLLPTDNDITAFCQDDSLNIYIGSSKGGLLKITPNNKITHIKLQDGVENFSVISLFYDHQQQLWAGTDGFGLKKLNPTTQRLESRTPASSPFDFSKSKIHSIAEDSDGNIWLAVFQKGLYLLGEESQTFENYGYRAFGDGSIGSNSVGALAINGDEIWVGTDGDGIYIITPNNNIQHIKLSPKNGELLSGNIISLCNQNGKYMWIGTFNDGLIKMEISTRKITKIYRSYADNPYGLESDRVSSILSCGNNKFLITTFGGYTGIFDANTEKFSPNIYGSKKNPIWANNITVDKKYNLWIAAYDGLLKIDSNSGAETMYTAETGFLPANTVNCTAIDTLGRIWIGTTSGIIVYDPQNDTKQYYSDTCGLAGNVICSIIQDNNENMWIATRRGLSCININTSAITTYTTADGISNNEFCRTACVKDSLGNIWLGGTKGVTKISTKSKNEKPDPGKVLLTYFLVNGNTINAGDKSNGKTITEKEIILSEKITINESDNIFSIGFAPSCPARKENTTYKYRLLGFDKQWKHCTAESPQATFTNLSHGKYIFEVIAQYKGTESEIRRINITILPPWYKTIYAKIGYIVIALAVLTLILLFIYERVKRRQDEAVNEMKMQFFINISHEIRTPLTLIIDPLEKLLNKPQDDETSRLYKIMQLNCERIYRLVSQLLDLRKIDKGQVMMRFGETEINSFVSHIIASIAPAAETKEITINQAYSQENIKAWIDPENFEKILLNLLSNAIKFTPIGGKISVDTSINNTKNTLEIKVSDTGIGLEPEDIKKIFQRFYQVRNSQTRYNTGTGVGLHLAKYLTELHKGQLYAENRTDTQGSRFIVEIPLGNKHLPPDSLVTSENIITAPIRQTIPTQTSNNTPQTIPQQTDNKEKNINQQLPKPKTKYKVMLVDDEDGIREYIAQELSSYCKTSAYCNGVEAYSKLILEMPDLIISDIMMPEMDGITFCKKVKHNAQTAHIPIILLTALDDDTHKTQGMEIGADMYMVKPFNTDYLKKAIKNLIENRKRVTDKAENRAENFQIENLQLKSADEILMQKVMQIIKENISRRDLNVEMLADNIGISRVHLHRKLKEITGLSARDFIKNIRMKQASYLLTVKKLNISETAYAVGYSNPAHFSASFKSFFGIPPLTYAKTANNN